MKILLLAGRIEFDISKFVEFLNNDGYSAVFTGEKAREYDRQFIKALEQSLRLTAKEKNG